MKVFLTIATSLLICQLAFGQSEEEYYAELMNEYKSQDFPVDIKCKRGAFADSLNWGELDELPTEVKSNILDQFKNSDNYLGSCYKYAIWGCGSPCQMIAFFRISSGELIGTLNASLGFKIDPNSRLIIVNPPTEQPIDLEYRQAIGGPLFFQLLNDQIVKAKK